MPPKKGTKRGGTGSDSWDSRGSTPFMSDNTRSKSDLSSYSVNKPPRGRSQTAELQKRLEEERKIAMEAQANVTGLERKLDQRILLHRVTDVPSMPKPDRRRANTADLIEVVPLAREPLHVRKRKPSKSPSPTMNPLVEGSPPIEAFAAVAPGPAAAPRERKPAAAKRQRSSEGSQEKERTRKKTYKIDPEVLKRLEECVAILDGIETEWPLKIGKKESRNKRFIGDLKVAIRSPKQMLKNREALINIFDQQISGKSKYFKEIENDQRILDVIKILKYDTKIAQEFEKLTQE